MERTILHVAIDSFPIQAERLRCPKLTGRPLALVPGESPRPRVIETSREAREAGVAPGTPLVLARRLCRDLVALPIDRDFYGGIGESIFKRLGPFAAVVDPGGGGGSGSAASGRFFLDLTGVARTHSDARDRASRAGRDVEAFFGLHPTLGVAANKLVSRVAAQVVAPDGDLLDVSSGSEASFLAPLPVDMLPAARGADVLPRLDLLSVRLVREVQALSLAHLTRASSSAGSRGASGGASSSWMRGGSCRPRRSSCYGTLGWRRGRDRAPRLSSPRSIARARASGPRRSCPPPGCCMASRFAHLHVHSHYSLMQGADTIEALAQAARGHGMDRFALTDTNALYGFVFYLQICEEQGLRPIAGAEVVSPPVNAPDRTGALPDRAVLLARGHEGYPSPCRVLT